MEDVLNFVIKAIAAIFSLLILFNFFCALYKFKAANKRKIDYIIPNLSSFVEKGGHKNIMAIFILGGFFFLIVFLLETNGFHVDGVTFTHK